MTNKDRTNVLYQEAMNAFLGRHYDRVIELLSEAVAIETEMQR